MGETTRCGPTADECDFYPIRIAVTAAACFSSCGGYDGMLPAWSDPDYILQSQPLSAGGSAIQDVKARGAAHCGDAVKDVNIADKNRNGAVIFELRARFHCAQCQERVDNPNCQ